jgi:hypothetical protein
MRTTPAAAASPRRTPSRGSQGVVVQVEIESKIEVKLKAVHHMLVSSA